jgi:hypothetical protein
MAALIGVFGQFITWFGAIFAARWGIKIAVIAAITATYATMWGILIAAVALLASLIPDSGLPAFLLQFFPSSGAIATATTAYYGSMMAKRSFDFWRESFGLIARVGGS